tara:strand:- start:335 stop:523 length:189 start_codon:yes stop_codon:yes gene_type:complete
MNKDTAINVLLKHAKGINKKDYKPDIQAITAAVLFMDNVIKSNKKDVKVEVKGLEFNLFKGV